MMAKHEKHRLSELSEKRIVLFGASQLGAEFIEAFESRLNIIGFIDNDKTKHGNYFHGIPVYSPTKCPILSPELIIVTSQYFEAISQQLVSTGIPFIHCSELLKKHENRLLQRLRLNAYQALYQVFKYYYLVTGRSRYDYLHIVPKGVFATAFKDLLTKDRRRKHHFLVRKTFPETPMQEGFSMDAPEVRYENGNWYPAFLSDVRKTAKAVAQSQHVMVHGYFNLARFPFLMDPALLKRATWVAWGRDIHSISPKGSFIDDMIVQSKVGFANLVTFMGYDRESAQKRYGFHGRCFNGFYPNPLPANDLHECQPKEIWRVMVGQSAVAELNHTLVLKALKDQKQQIELVLPISYGDRAYAKNVAAMVRQHFPRNEVLSEYMAPGPFARWLSSIDVAIMHTHTQIALSTIYALLYTGATVYLNKSNQSLWSHISEKFNLIVLDSNELLEGQDVRLLSENQKQHNRKEAAKLFDLNWISDKWQNIFDSVERI
ncbi:hypothetical protein [Lacimicrobium alkaliphilum]|uniref:Polysaccharide pyruvyl transferase domain-containing protein n=1 Tax=Lacimicrobium alkaliphilum TaxID=1526571 RepID=A0A0U2JJ86_9ALTE|nr:hypothetical protein [Lacimicrobium alkaliphilum]ALS99062.1 hypothetical protein AT746_12840 [Lacimicrobium alkaliphilum]